MGFRHALELIRNIKTEAEVNAAFGPPNYVETFNPGHPNDPLPLNSLPRDLWSSSEVFIPPTLIESLSIGTKMIMNEFATGVFGVTGALTA
jgi:hypothetical protein